MIKRTVEYLLSELHEDIPMKFEESPSAILATRGTNAVYGPHRAGRSPRISRDFTSRLFADTTPTLLLSWLAQGGYQLIMDTCLCGRDFLISKDGMSMVVSWKANDLVETGEDLFFIRRAFMPTVGMSSPLRVRPI